MSHSSFLLGLDQFLAGIPIFLFSLIGGVVADRTERRKILMVSQYIQMASAGILTMLVTIGPDAGVADFVPVVCFGLCAGVWRAGVSALIPTLVEREDMPNAIALNSIQFNLAVTVGPALAGMTLARLGEKWCFGLNALSFLAPIISLSMISARFLPVATTESMFGSLKQGIQVSLRQQGSMVGADRAGVPDDFLEHADADLYSGVRERYFPSRAGDLWELTVADGSGIDPRIARRWRAWATSSNKGRFALSMLICLGAGISGFSLSKFLPLSYAMLVLVGASMMAVFATVTSLVQLITTNEMRGRVMSVYNCAFRGGMPMGNLVSGWLVPMFTATDSVWA